MDYKKQDTGLVSPTHGLYTNLSSNAAMQMLNPPQPSSGLLMGHHVLSVKDFSRDQVMCNLWVNVIIMVLVKSIKTLFVCLKMCWDTFYFGQHWNVLKIGLQRRNLENNSGLSKLKRSCKTGPQKTIKQLLYLITLQARTLESLLFK